MEIYEAINLLRDDSIVLVNERGDEFQRINNDSIMQIWNKDLLENGDCSVGSSIKNGEFIEKYIKSKFDVVEQWYQKDIKFPILCKVKESGWNDYKVVCFKSKDSRSFHTQCSESYTPSYRTEIKPLTDNEIKNLFRGF